MIEEVLGTITVHGRNGKIVWKQSNPKDGKLTFKQHKTPSNRKFDKAFQEAFIKHFAK